MYKKNGNHSGGANLRATTAITGKCFFSLVDFFPALRKGAKGETRCWALNYADETLYARSDPFPNTAENPYNTEGTDINFRNDDTPKKEQWRVFV